MVPGSGPWSNKAGSFSGHLVNGQSRIHQVDIFLSKMCQVLGLLKILSGTGPKAQQVVFLFGVDILMSSRCTLNVPAGSDIKVVWSSLLWRGSDSINNEGWELAKGFKRDFFFSWLKYNICLRDLEFCFVLYGCSTPNFHLGNPFITK